MKKISLIAALLLVSPLGLPLYGEETPPPEKEPPKISFEEVDHDFGKIYQGEKVSYNYVFWNKGGSDLFIEKVKSSCGCTSALISDKTIPPGEKGEIKTTFSSGGRRGKQRKSITVMSNDPANRIAKLTISGEIIVPLQFEPPRIQLKEVIFGQEREGEARVVVSEEFGDLKITEARSSSPHIEATIHEPEPPQEKRGPLAWIGRLFRRKKKEKEKEEPPGTTLHVRISPEAPKGRLFGRITVRYEGDKKGEATIPVYARIIGNITARPERIFLGSIMPGAGKEVSIVIADRRGKDLVIRDIETGSESLEVEQVPEDNSRVKLLVRVKPGTPAGAIRGKLKLLTGDKEEPTLEIPYSGNVRPPKPPQ